MNDNLKKEIITPEQKVMKRRGYSKKHMEKCKTMCVTLRMKEDADILEWLEKHENKSEGVREVIREKIREENKPKIGMLFRNPISSGFDDDEEE
jgi:hypothetical protein